MNVRPMRAALRSSINGSTARGGSDLGGVGPTGLKWVIQYTPSVIYIYKHGPGISPLRKIWDYMVCIWIINHLRSGMHILYGSYVVDVFRRSYMGFV